MTLSQRAIFFEMLIEQWIRETLPDDPGAIADAIANTEEQAEEIRAAWPTLRRQFVTDEQRPGRIINLALERVRSDRLKWLERQRQAGKKSAEKRAAERQQALTTVQAASTSRVELSRDERKVRLR